MLGLGNSKEKVEIESVGPNSDIVCSHNESGTHLVPKYGLNESLLAEGEIHCASKYP